MKEQYLIAGQLEKPRCSNCDHNTTGTCDNTFTGHKLLNNTLCTGWSEIRLSYGTTEMETYKANRNARQ